MTITFHPDPRHVNLTSHICPRCGARRDEFRPCPECGEERTWAQAQREATVRRLHRPGARTPGRRKQVTTPAGAKGD